jgi:pectate lyase
MPKLQRVTFYGNLFRNIRRRSPRAASGSWAHVFNNLVTGWGGAGPCRGNDYGFGSSANAEGQLFAEANVYVARKDAGACQDAIEVSEKVSAIGDPRGPGLARARDNLLLNGASVRENDPEHVFNPRDRSQAAAYYPYSLLQAKDVRAYVLSHAGPEKKTP